MSEVPHRTIVNVRGTASDPAFSSAVQSATGVALPSAANTVFDRRQRGRSSGSAPTSGG